MQWTPHLYVLDDYDVFMHRQAEIQMTASEAYSFEFFSTTSNDSKSNLRKPEPVLKCTAPQAVFDLYLDATRHLFYEGPLDSIDFHYGIRSFSTWFWGSQIKELLWNLWLLFVFLPSFLFNFRGKIYFLWPLFFWWVFLEWCICGTPKSLLFQLCFCQNRILLRNSIVRYKLLRFQSWPLNESRRVPKSNRFSSTGSF